MKKDYISSSIDALTKDAVEKTGIPLIPPQSVLIVVRGMILAHSVPVAINSCSITINQDMKAMRTNQRILPTYLLTLIQGIKQSIFDYIDSSAHGTKKLEWDQFENILLPVPPASEQEANANKILEKTNELDSLSSMSNRNIALLEERRSALISAAVTGKIDVRDWQPPKAGQTASEPAEASA